MGDWGSPTNYDLVVTREGKEKDTRYTLNPKPAKPLDEGILRLYSDMNIDLNALYRGDDPFNSEPKDESEQIAEDADKEISGIDKQED